MNKKSVLVTGSSRGIGKACALLFARNHYHVFLNCSSSPGELLRVKSEIEQLPGGSCDLLPGDVSDSTVVRHMFDQIKQTCSGLDVLVNNAGIAHLGLLMDMTDDEWDRVIRTNLSSVFYCCRAAIPYMVSQKSGKIINISSMWGSCGASCEVAYSASKSGINGLTRALAKELAPSNIQVNAIACGVIETAMNDCLNDEARSILTDEIPAGRFGTPEEIAELAVSIAGAPAYMTGQIIGADGGYL